MGVDVTVKTVIERSVERVASFATDPDNVPIWYKNIHKVEWVTERPLRVGSQIAFVARFMGRTLSYTYEITQLVPNECLVMRTSEGPFPMETSYRWNSTAEGVTTMTLRNRGAPTGFSKLLAPVMALMMRRETQKDLARLKLHLESGKLN